MLTPTHAHVPAGFEQRVLFHTLPSLRCWRAENDARLQWQPFHTPLRSQPHRTEKRGPRSTVQQSFASTPSLQHTHNAIEATPLSIEVCNVHKSFGERRVCCDRPAARHAACMPCTPHDMTRMWMGHPIAHYHSPVLATRCWRAPACRCPAAACTCCWAPTAAASPRCCACWAACCRLTAAPATSAGQQVSCSRTPTTRWSCRPSALMWPSAWAGAQPICAL